VNSPQAASAMEVLALDVDRAVEQAIALCDGDMRAALRAVVVANAFLMTEVDQLTQLVSVGFARKRSPARAASEQLDLWREISGGSD
jgi:hypothetical protein